MTITKDDGDAGTWTATCDQDNVDGHRCGGFTSAGHPTRKAASERLDEHLKET